MEPRLEDCGRGRSILGGSSQSLRDCGQAGDRWRKASGEDGPEGNPVRRSGEVEGVFPFNFVGGGPVPPRLSKDFERWLVACHQSEEVASGQGGSLDEEFRGNRRETGGRAEQIEGKSRGPGEPQEARRRRERKGEEQYVRRKLKKEEGQEAEEKEKGEGQERRKRRKCQENPRVKGSFRGLRKHRTRPRLSGPAQSGQEGKEDCQKEGKTFFVKLKRKQQQLQRRGAFRLRAFRTRGQSEGCVASGSRSADLQYVGADANCASPTEWPTLGCPEGSIATSLQPILAADFRFQGKSPYEQGNADPELHSGSAAARKGVECCGRDHPTPQEFGADCFSRRLSGEPQTGASTFRCKFDEQHQGDDGSVPTPERGAESKERGEAALGETTKRRLAPMGQRERKERRWSQRRERRWQEGKEQGRRKRGDSEERGCKKVMPEDVAMPKKRISPSPEHGGDISPMHGLQGGQGRWFVPSHTPPVVEKASECFSVAGDLSLSNEASAGNFGGATDTPGSERFCPSGALSKTEDSTWEVAGLKFLEVFPHLCEVFDDIRGLCEIKHSKVKSSGGIFPLPETPQGLTQNGIQVEILHASCVLGVCRALNSYYGIVADDGSPPTMARKSALERLCTYVDECAGWSDKCGRDDWASLLK